MLKNTSSEYGLLTRALHWLMALLIIGLVIAGFLIDEVPKDNKLQLINLHKAAGFIVLILALFRWYWTLTNEKVQALANWSKKDIAISHTSKWLLMLLMLVMPISGMMMSMYAGYGIDVFGLFEITPFVEKSKAMGGIFHETHEIAGFAISAIILLHIAAAFKHHFVVKDQTLSRMLGKK